jgi:hypothetical protein
VEYSFSGRQYSPFLMILSILKPFEPGLQSIGIARAYGGGVCVRMFASKNILHYQLQ